MAKIILDAAGQRLGRLACQIAIFLQGKDLTSFTPNQPLNRLVEVKNIDQLELSSQKKTAKAYKTHSGYLGHLKIRSYSSIGPRKALVLAVARMLPKNRLRKRLLKHLKINHFH